MTRANHNPTSTRRRFLTIAAAGAAAVAIPAVPALAAGADPDRRLRAIIAQVRPMLAAYTAAGEHAHELHALVDADPDMPEESCPLFFAQNMLANGSPLSERTLGRLHRARTDRIWERHGARAAYAEWNRLGDDLRSILARLLAIRPQTAAGAHEKWQVIYEGYNETDQWYPEDFDEFMVPALLADLKRLGRAAL